MIRQIKRGDIGDTKADEPAGADAATDTPLPKRKRGRPRKDNYFAFADDTAEDPVKGGVPCEAHHHIANDQTQWDDYINVVALNEDDPALRVSIGRALLSAMLTSSGRNLYLTCTITCSHGYFKRNSTAENTRIRRINATRSASSIDESTGTKPCG